MFCKFIKLELFFLLSNLGFISSKLIEVFGNKLYCIKNI